MRTMTWVHGSTTRWATAVGAATLVTVLGAAAPASAATTNWRADGFGPGNGGYNAAETTITPATFGRLKYRWSIVSPVERFSCREQTPPVVAGGRLYVADQGGVAAYNARTGARVWTVRFPTPEELTPRLAIVDGRLFVTRTDCISQSDPGADLIVLNGATGATLWTKGRAGPNYRLLVDRGVAVVSGGSASGINNVEAYNAATGAVLWTIPDADLMAPVSAGGRVLVTQLDDELEPAGADLVDITTGKVLWHVAANYHVLAAGSGGQLFAADGDDLVCLTVSTGAVQWRIPHAAPTTRFDDGGEVTGLLAVDGPRVYVARGPELQVRGTTNGALLWSVKEFGANVRLGKPVVAGGLVYVTVEGHRVNAYEAATGREASGDQPTFEGAIGHPVVVNGRMYVTDGRVLDMFSPPA